MVSLPRTQSHCAHLIGIDVGGSKLLACLTDRNGHILRTERREIGCEIRPDELLCLIEDVIQGMTRGGFLRKTSLISASHGQNGHRSAALKSITPMD